ncbi:uncharacterized protein C2845_PM04G11600 [Panicum miliaceum]|uniref:Uncharacterized protein n=1 Tax=Panicum miliaceum TaxID=4540 RepID=A0A3L6QVY6_PANMI|nr:uncharacterized protein C2845_PM04G11600 [Panicum miliaceum]
MNHGAEVTCLSAMIHDAEMPRALPAWRRRGSQLGAREHGAEIFKSKMPRRGKSSKPKVMTWTTFTRLPLPSGGPVPMCFCGDPSKVAKSDEEESYNKRYWMYENYAFNPTPRQIRIGLLTPPPLCDFEQWIDTDIKEEDKEHLRRMKEWDAEQKELLEQRRQEKAAEKEWKEELERRHAAQHKEEREHKLERVPRAKTIMEENPDALRKGKWPRCTQ